MPRVVPPNPPPISYARWTSLYAAVQRLPTYYTTVIPYGHPGADIGNGQEKLVISGLLRDGFAPFEIRFGTGLSQTDFDYILMGGQVRQAIDVSSFWTFIHRCIKDDAGYEPDREPDPKDHYWHELLRG